MKRSVLTPLIAVASTAVLIAGLSQVPSRQVVAAPVEVATTRTLTCPAGDPATLATTVLAASGQEFTSRPVGDTASPAPVARYLRAPVTKPAALAGGASLGGLSQSAVATGAFKGLWLAPCRAPAAEQWFSGVVSSSTERAWVELVNIDPGQAVVDLTILGKDGRVAAAGARGLVVPGGSARTVALEPLVNATDPIGILVKTSEGRVGASVRMAGSSGGDWAVPAAAPATSQVVPIVPGGDGVRTLVVTNPGSRRATVTVEALDATSSFAPAGAAQVDVNPESTVAVPLEGALKGALVAVRLTSTQPVTAGVRVVAGGDMALVGSGSPLTAPVQVPVLPGAQLFVANAGTEVATVTLTSRSAEGGEIDVTSTDLEPGRSAQLPVTGERTASIEVSSPNVDVRGALVISSAGGVTGTAVAVLGDRSPTRAAPDPSLDPALPR